MKTLKQLFKFYIDSSLHVAFAVVALLWVMVLEYNLTVENALWGFVFLGTVTGYNFVKYATVAGLHHRKLTNSLKSIQVFSLFCFFGLVYFTFYLSINTILTTVGFGFLTFFYAVPLLRHKNLRNFSGLKVFIVALVWAGVTVVIPVISAGENYITDFTLSFLQRFLLVVVLIFPFEIRDVSFDGDALGTFPQKIGVTNTKIAGVTILFGILVLELLKNELMGLFGISLLMVCFATALFLVFSKTKQSRYYASFWVEAMPIFWLLLLILLTHFV